LVGKVALSFVKVGTKKETKKAIPIILSHKRNVNLSRWFARDSTKVLKASPGPNCATPGTFKKVRIDRLELPEADDMDKRVKFF
jgi:hypothetical protein